MKAKKSLCDRKAAGPDDIHPDVDKIIMTFAEKLIVEGLKPGQWSGIDLITLPKCGNLSDIENYSWISLSSVVAKVVNKMILNRIQPEIHSLLRRNGFHPGRSTVGHILALRRLIEGVQSKNRTAVIRFVDFKKAFDSLHRGKMFSRHMAYHLIFWKLLW